MTFFNCTIYTYGHKYQQIPRNSFVSSVTIEVKIQATTQKKHEYTTALDAQFGTPYPRSAGFDTDIGAFIERSTVSLA